MLHPAQSHARLLRVHFRTSTPYGRQGPYRNVATTYWPWPTLDVLRPHLEILEINTGRQYTLTGLTGLSGLSGIVTDDREGLHAIADERGQVMLRPGTEFPTAVYRGQTEEHLPCMPSLARMPIQKTSCCRSAAAPPLKMPLVCTPMFVFAHRRLFLMCRFALTRRVWRSTPLLFIEI